MSQRALSEPRRIGSTSVEISALGLGCAALAGIYTEITDDQATQAVDAARAAGITYFDTAPIYGAGLSEVRLGAALRDVPRDDVVISSKVGYDLVPLGPGEQTWQQWPGGLPFRGELDFSAGATRRSIEATLDRLGVDRLDLVWIHDPDGGRGGFDGVDPYIASHFSEAMDGAYAVLHDLRAQGVVRAIGVGINQAPMLVDFARAGDFDAFLLAGRYTLLEQDPLDELLPICEQQGISIVVGGPYNSGILASGAVPGARYNYEPADDAVLKRVGAIEQVCARHGVSLRAVALQFVLAHPAVASVIPGARSAAEIADAVHAVETSVPVDLWDELKDAGLLRADAPC